MKNFKFFFNYLKIIFINIFVFLFFFIVFIYLLEFYYKIKNDYNFKEDVMFFGYQSPDRQMHTFDLYPYTNFHTQSNFSIKSKYLVPYWPHDYYEEMHYESGQNGFFTEFNLKNPPPKKSNEIRIVITGGSAAQGWGASSNENMFYSILEDMLNKKSKKNNYSVINLAMGGSVTYENFITLNKWAHKLDPDIIISFSLNNDLNYPNISGSDTSTYFYNLMGLLESTKTSNSKFKIFLANNFPNINKSPIGFAINFLNIKKNSSLAKEKYLKNNSLNDIENVNQYIHSLNSIKRDFPNVPLLLALQPSTLFISQNVISKEKLQPIKIFEMDRLKNLYEMTLDRIQKDMQNKLFAFVDFNDYFLKNDLFSNQYLIDFCHLSDEGHIVVAEKLFDVIKDIKI